MIRTAKILYRPEGWASEILLFHIEDVAERMGKSRREVDRMVDAGELTKILWKGLSCIPAHELHGLDMEDGNDDSRGSQAGRSTARPEAETEHRPETSTGPATPWEELSYEAR